MALTSMLSHFDIPPTDSLSAATKRKRGESAVDSVARPPIAFQCNQFPLCGLFCRVSFHFIAIDNRSWHSTHIDLDDNVENRETSNVFVVVQCHKCGCCDIKLIYFRRKGLTFVLCPIERSIHSFRF